MKYWIVLLLGISLGIASGPSWGQERSLLLQIQDYMNQIKTLRAHFTQTSQDQPTAQGLIFLSRPGKMRVVYQSPTKDYIVADGSTLYYWDDELEQVSRIEQRETLAEVLLAETFLFNQTVKVHSLIASPESVRVTVTKLGNPELGRLTLVFDRDPFALSYWIVIDPQGAVIKTELTDIETGVTFHPAYFFFQRPG